MILPETAKRPLEEMRYLFTKAPLFVPTMDMEKFRAGQDLEIRVEEVQHEKEEVAAKQQMAHYN